MGVLPDWMIERDIKIEPFAAQQHRPGVISYGVTSYGYDVRVDRRFKVFTNVWGRTVDPKQFDPKSFVDVDADACIIPPNSFALAETVEYLEIPRDILCVCVGKCLTADTRVVDAETGDYLPIREFVAGRRSRTVGLGGWKLRPTAVADHIPNGTKPVFELRTRCGLKLKATANHPLRTIDGWVALGDLRPADRIAVARSCPVFGRGEWSESEATLLGLLMGEGRSRSPVHPTHDQRLSEVMDEAAAAVGLGLHTPSAEGAVATRLSSSTQTTAWLRQFAADLPAVYSAVPSIVFRSSRPAVAAFLRALFSGIGAVYASSSIKGTRGICVEFAGVSERMIRDVRHLLLRFGIFSLVRERESPSRRTSYRVQITDLEMIRRFAAEVGFLDGTQKQLKLIELLDEVGDRQRQKSNFDTLPPAIWDRLRLATQRCGKSLNSLGVRVMARQSVPYGFAEAVATATATADPDLGGLVGGDVVWDTVESITPAGVEPVYDIEVPDGHNFVADDVVVHNSTYARCGIIVNVTPLEPEWRGRVTIEISNTTPLPAKIYAGEGIAQIIFLKAQETCRTSYADKKGKYQDQPGLTLPFVPGTGSGSG